MSLTEKDSPVARFNERQRKRRLATCQHFTGRNLFGTGPDECTKGIDYKTVVGRAPYSISCIRNEHWTAGGCPPCAAYEARTVAQVDEEDARHDRAATLISKGLSPCCEAPLDESEVITTPPHIGHGPRFCSKCKRVVFWV